METPVLDWLQSPWATAFSVVLSLGIAFSGAAIAAIFLSSDGKNTLAEKKETAPMSMGNR